ncbi:hypothetical protein LshimejAT787_0310070 [Lyophyllum shimeji]|uniref:SnoaL-like domain-containing protein n=1 Tax=Lyophyllum shimeji TaxID=47721 RepID=A0A9P3PID1_LYOSH|nr:hypothetical protein LshimejAT787_0310070 [Lyophyllum shimeji]
MVAISNHLKLAFAWVTATNQLNYDQLTALSADNFVSIIRPASLGVPNRNKTQLIADLKAAPIQTFNISLPTTENILETPDAIQFYTTADGHTTHGFPWKTEYILSFTFAGDSLIQSVAEFTDPTVVNKAFGNEAIVAQAQFTCP